MKIKKLPAGAHIYKDHNGSTTFWRARLGKRFTGGGEIKKTFRSAKEAQNWIDDQFEARKSHGEKVYHLTPNQMAEAIAAFKSLEGRSLTTAVDYFLKHANPSGGTRTWAEIQEEFLTSRRAIGCKPKTLVQYESYLRLIGEEWGKVSLTEIKRQDIEDWLAESDWSPRTRKNYLVTLTTVFNWAMDREYCPFNPAERIQRPLMDDRAPGILTPDQTSILLQAATNCLPEMIPGIAIGLFAGLRRSEICSLDWDEIDLTARHIEVKGTKAKTRQRRLVSISNNLFEWLKPCEQKAGPVAPNVDVFGEKLKHLVRGRPKTDDDPGRPPIVPEWPHNALRHSFGSYFFAKTKNENLTAANMGNSPAMVFKHYRALVKDKDVAAYWGIKPRRHGN